MPSIPGTAVIEAEIPAQKVGIEPGVSLPATTTKQEDLTTAGQRRVNLIWEYTQAVIAVMVVGCTMVVGSWVGIMGREGSIPNILATAFGMITGFYFARTNHAAIGGLGTKPTQKYEGR